MDEILKLVQHFADQNQIDWHWIAAIIQQESAWNCYAIRFEPSFSYFYKPDEYAKKTKITLSTEINAQKTSWGLGQIMGGLAREQGLEESLARLVIPEINIGQICLRIKTLKKYSNEVSDIFAMYNGGPGAIHKAQGKYLNQTYVDSVTSHLQKFQSQDTID